MVLEDLWALHMLHTLSLPALSGSQELLAQGAEGQVEPVWGPPDAF